MKAFSPTSARLRTLAIVILGTLAFLASGPSLRAQTAAAGTGPRPQVAAGDQNASQVREEFMKTLQRYPPTVSQVLKLDPTLMSREDYLLPYPAIAAFLAQYPEVRRSPDYFLSQVNTPYYYDSRSRALENMFEMFGVFVIILTLVTAVGWLLRSAMDYRRWGRQAKVQADAHTKLLDRLTSNDELLAYVQSSAGSRFLQSAPITLDGAPKAMGAPFSRILWSMQAGVVLAAAGIGMNYVSRRVHPDSADPVFTLSVILLSLGVGFFVSAGLSFVLSRRLGLLSFDKRDAEA